MQFASISLILVNVLAYPLNVPSSFPYKRLSGHTLICRLQFIPRYPLSQSPGSVGGLCTHAGSLGSYLC